MNRSIDQSHKMVKYSTVQSAIKVINYRRIDCSMSYADIKVCLSTKPDSPFQIPLPGLPMEGKLFL